MSISLQTATAVVCLAGLLAAAGLAVIVSCLKPALDRENILARKRAQANLAYGAATGAIGILGIYFGETVARTSLYSTPHFGVTGRIIVITGIASILAFMARGLMLDREADQIELGFAQL